MILAGHRLGAASRTGKKAAAVFDPATLTLGLWQRASYAGAPWGGTASAGGSGSRNLAAGSAPGTGTAQNGFDPADFDGAAHVLVNATAIGTVATAAAGSILALFRADTAAAAGLVYDDPALVADSGGFAGLHFSDSGVRGYVDDGGTKTISVACGTGAYHLAQMKWDNVNLKVRVDSGSWASVAAGTISNASGTIVVGRNYTTAFFDGRILEVMIAPSALADADFDNIKSYVNARYALAL